MISRKPLAERNDNPVPQKDDGASPQKTKDSQLEHSGRLFSADSGFVSPETICRPRLSASRRSSPANACKPFSSFRIEDATESCHIAENELPSKAIADLWTKPLKNTGPQLSTKTPRHFSFSSEGSNTPNRFSENLPPTKLSFDNCESSADECSPQPAPCASRKGVGYRRSLSYTEPESSKKEAFRLFHTESTPVCNPKRHKFENDDNSPYKSYLEPPRNFSPFVSNSDSIKQKSEKEATEGTLSNKSSSLTPEVKRLCFTRSQSESALISHCSIKKAVERIESNPCLIGDGSKPYILPFTLNGKHQDLKEIAGDTLLDLMNGKMRDSINSFKVIDCRYPYEYIGGHIRGAINLVTKKDLFDELMQPKMLGNTGSSSEERNILIFHCEFSSQRGPEMCRFLRDTDRETNASSYPHLHYPELYVLFGGYKAFFEQFPTSCQPQSYMPMDHPDHAEDCRYYKSRTKLDYPTNMGNRFKKSKSHNKFARAASFAKKCNF